MSPESPEYGTIKRGDLTSLVRCFRLLKLSHEDLEDFSEWKGIKPPSKSNWDTEWNRCERVQQALNSGKSEEEAKEYAKYGEKRDERGISISRLNNILSAAKVLCERLNISEQIDVKKWSPDINKWKSEGSSSNNQINLSNPYLPTKTDIDFADYQLRKSSDKVIDIKDVLDQIEVNINTAGKSLKENWRHITKRNIEVWFRKEKQ